MRTPFLSSHDGWRVVIVGLPSLSAVALAFVSVDAAIAIPASAEAANAAGRMTCPARLASDQKAIASPGWIAQRTARDAPLENITLYDGPPADQIELAPATVRREKGSQLAQWRIDGAARPTMACRYRGTDIVLARPLPARVRQCTLRTRAGAGLFDPAGLSCR